MAEQCIRARSSSRTESLPSSVQDPSSFCGDAEPGEHCEAARRAQVLCRHQGQLIGDATAHGFRGVTLDLQPLTLKSNPSPLGDATAQSLRCASLPAPTPLLPPLPFPLPSKPISTLLPLNTPPPTLHAQNPASTQKLATMLALLSLGANSNAQDDAGGTALQRSAFKGDEACVKALIDAGKTVS